MEGDGELMSERALRGSRLGAASYEDDREIAPAPRQLVSYDCPHSHHFDLPFAADAEVPAVWECPRCGAEAVRVDGDRPESKQVKPPRTHWDMLLERRSIDELEQLLSERLELLRSGQIGPEHLHREASAGGKTPKPPRQRKGA
ncbi:RNA polymerase-binding protein RbpA [Actinopolymorpha rutila]